MFKLEEYTYDHLCSYAESTGVALDSLRGSIAGEKAFALVKDTRTVAIFWGGYLRGGVVYLGSFISDEARKHPMKLTRIAKKLLDIHWAACNIHRYEITVEVSDKRAAAWAKVLGFECEGYIRRCGEDRSDHYLFGRV